MQTMDNALTVGNESPSVILATRATYNYYYALLQPQQRFVDTETAGDELKLWLPVRIQL